MKKIVTIIGVAFASLFMFTGCGYNGIVSQKEAVEQQWANVENQYQKRADLVPNLVATVKGFAKHEEKVFTELAEARSKLGGTVSVDASITDDPEKLAQFQKTQRELGAGLGRLLALTIRNSRAMPTSWICRVSLKELKTELLLNAKDTMTQLGLTTSQSRCSLA